MRALLVLDRGSADIFRTYIAKRDGEHEPYAPLTLYPEFVARYGMTTDDDIRLAVALKSDLLRHGWREQSIAAILASVSRNASPHGIS